MGAALRTAYAAQAAESTGGGTPNHNMGEILMPIKQDGRKNNGGHKNAGRKPMKNPKRTGSMRLSDADWAWLDDPANGKSRGEIVSRFIAEKRD